MGKVYQFILVLTFSFLISFSQTTAFTTPGTTSWTVPGCVTQITVEVWGAGGGGGASWSKMSNGCSTSCQESCVEGGGGGGGGYAKRVYSVSTGQVYTIVVGAGGNGGTSSSSSNSATNGVAGGASTFSGPATSGPGTLTGNGGGAGGGANNNNTDPYDWGTHQGANGTAGSGGSGANGTTAYSGGNGTSGAHSGSCYDFSGAGGGGAGNAGNGGAGSSNTCPSTSKPGGTGGTSNGGAGGAGQRLSGYTTHAEVKNGLAGTTIGGGGSGCMIHYNASAGTGTRNGSGGAGARGEVRITIDCSLPIGLVFFKGICNDYQKTFTWTTATETNNAFFTIERSADGINFEPIKIIQGAGNSSQYQYYSATIPTEEIQYIYYRLKQTDFDGAFSYSNITVVECQNKEYDYSSYSIFPNPVNDNLSLQFNHLDKGIYSVSIINILSQEVYTTITEKSSESSIVNIPLQLSNGSYLLKITDETRHLTLSNAKFFVVK